jgi:glutathione S-transferase
LVAEGGFDMSSYPRLGAWLQRVRARPGWRKAEELVFGG